MSRTALIHAGRRATGVLLSGAVVVLACRGEPRAPAGEPASVATPAPAAFVGSAACAGCHATEHAAWLGSDHQRAMAPAGQESVLGDFSGVSFTRAGVTSRFFRRADRYWIATEGADGRTRDFEVVYAFGVRPLQQYLVELPGGRLQAFWIAWDSGRRRWFDLYPGQAIAASDWLHWTRGGQGWNGMCAACHSTNVRKGYDPGSDSYDTTWSEVSVGCEACHGPASAHVAWAKAPAGERAPLAASGLPFSTRARSSRQRIELCASCHARRAELGDDDHRGAPLLDHALPSLIVEGLYEADGQQLDEVYTYGSFLQSRMFARGLDCADCHDPHAAELRGPGNAVCVRCHNPIGTALRPGIDGSGLRRKDYDSPAHHFHRAGRPGSACVDCHAPPRVYMVVDPRHDHSFRVPRPDLGPATGSPDACTACHRDRSPAWAAAAVARWYGAGRRREPHYGEAFAAARRGDPAALPALRALVAGDGGEAASPLVRATALDLLGGDPDPVSRRIAAAALASDEPLLRQVAAGALQAGDPAERLAALAPLLGDPVRAVRLAAVSAVAALPRDRFDAAQRLAFDRARGEYEAAMRRSLDFASSAANLGNLYANLGDAAEAERYYRSALAIDDLYFPARVNFAVLLVRQGRADEAESELRVVLEQLPENDEATYSLALLLVERGSPREAAGLLRKLLARRPAYPRAGYNLGLLLAQLGEAAEARRTLEAALARAPADYDLLFALADLELRSGRAREALALAERLAAVAPGDENAARLRAAAARAAGR